MSKDNQKTQDKKPTTEDQVEETPLQGAEGGEPSVGVEEPQVEEEVNEAEDSGLEERPLDDYSMKELQEKAKEVGFANPDIFTSKKQVIAVINDLKVRDVIKQAKPGQSVANLPVATDNIAGDRKQWRGKARIMKEKLDSQPKVQTFLSLSGKEKPGKIVEIVVDGQKKKIIKNAYETVTLNGHVTYVPKGVPVMVPQQVAEILGQAQAQTAVAGQEFLVDRDEGVEKALT